MEKIMKNETYIYCPNCGKYWIPIGIHIIDFECPNCRHSHYNGNVEIVTKKEFEELKYWDNK